MDSDDCLPRTAPKPSYAPVQNALHLVPEVSLLFDKPSNKSHPLAVAAQSPPNLPFVNFSSWRNFQMCRQVHFENEVTSNNNNKLVQTTLTNCAVTPKSSKIIGVQSAQLSVDEHKDRSPTIALNPLKSVKHIAIHSPVSTQPATKQQQSPPHPQESQTRPIYTCASAVDITKIVDMIESQNSQIKVLHNMMELILNEMARSSSLTEQRQVQPEQPIMESKAIQCPVTPDNSPKARRSVKKNSVLQRHQSHHRHITPQQKHRFDNCLYRTDGAGSSAESSTSDESSQEEDDKNYIHFYGGVIGKTTTKKLMDLPCSSSIGSRKMHHHLPPKLSPDFLAALPPAQTDRSLAMNTLALKYLPEDKLNELIGGTSSSSGSRGKVFASNDMSMATYRYMEKFSLLNGNNGNNEERNGRGDKNFLDSSAIKKQPKFI